VMEYVYQRLIEMMENNSVNNAGAQNTNLTNTSPLHRARHSAGLHYNQGQEQTSTQNNSLGSFSTNSTELKTIAEVTALGLTDPEEIIEILCGDQDFSTKRAATYQLTVEIYRDDLAQLSKQQTDQIVAFLVDSFPSRKWHFGLPRFSQLLCTEAPGISIGLNYADYSEDEWFLVNCCVNLSQIQPNLLMRFADEDGAFILIEGADALPDWLQPSNSNNRDWLYQGQFKLLTSSPDQLLSFSEAVALLKSSPTPSSPAFDKAIKARLNVFQSINSRLQDYQIHLMLPVRLAYLLDQCENSLSLLVGYSSVFLQDLMHDPMELSHYLGGRKKAHSSEEIAFTMPLSSKMEEKTAEVYEKLVTWSVSMTKEHHYLLSAPKTPQIAFKRTQIYLAENEPMKIQYQLGLKFVSRENGFLRRASPSILVEGERRAETEGFCERRPRPGYLDWCVAKLPLSGALCSIILVSKSHCI
ncbi:hypothetical protein Ciccas_008010, partial [Cichlidogyrus casuarinus]